MTQRVSISDNDFLAPPRVVMEGAKPVYIITCPGVTTITNDATLQMFVYKGTNDVTSTFTTGSMGVAGNRISTKTFQDLIGGDELFVTIFTTMDGILDCACAFPLNVKKKSGR